jgi:hypothetical protein
VATNSQFSSWCRWARRDRLHGIEQPGIYVVARSLIVLEGRRFSWRPDIIYIGMTNAVAGLRGRLQQFHNTIAKKRVQHGGADRLLYKYQSFRRLESRLWVSVAAFKCDPRSYDPRDLRVMGRVAQYEYECLAAFAQRFGRVPPFNNRKESPKYSRTVGKTRR